MTEHDAQHMIDVGTPRWLEDLCGPVAQAVKPKEASSETARPVPGNQGAGVNLEIVDGMAPNWVSREGKVDLLPKAPAFAGVRNSGVKRRLMEHCGGGGRLDSTLDGFGKVSRSATTK